MQLHRIAFLPAADDGCAFYRLWLPHLRIEGARWVQADEKGLVQYSQFADCKIGIVQRLMSDKNFETLQAMKELGIKIAYDLDDDMWAVQASNPAKNLLRQIENYIRGFETCARQCDVITVSTNRLKSSVENRIGSKVPIVVVGNAVDTTVFQPCIIPRDDDRVIIGWGGSNTHINDLAQMGKALDSIMSKNKKAFLHFVGMQPPGNNLQFHERVAVHGWVPVKTYPAHLANWNWDIGLAPLENNRFNKSKSSIKMIEMGALKKPCLASPVQPYLEFVSFNKELEWLLCESEVEWTKKLDALINDKDLRTHYGEVMYNVVKENYSMEKRVIIWKQVFMRLLQ